MTMMNKIKNIIELELEEVKENLKKRAERNDFTGTEFDLFNIDLEHKDFAGWDWQDRESHNFELGQLIMLKYLLDEINRLENERS